MVDHCVAAFSEYKKEEAFRYYLTDALKAKWQLNIRYADLFKPQETRTAEQIIKGISAKLNALGGVENEPV